MTYRRAVISLGIALALVLAWMAFTILPAQQQLGRAEEHPTAGCENYNTEKSALRAFDPQREVQSGRDAEKTHDQHGYTGPDISAATLEAACQANAISLAGVRIGSIGVIVASTAIALAVFALLVPTILAEMGDSSGRRRGASTVELDAIYEAGRGAGGWVARNRGDAIAFVHGIVVAPFPHGGVGSAIAAAATFTGNGFVIAPGKVERFDWNGIPHPGDLIVALKFTDSAGVRGVSWARFGLDGTPACHRKQEHGCVQEL